MDDQQLWQAGPDLDAEISRRVFGKSWVKHPYCIINGVRQDIETWLPDEDWCSPDDPPGGWTWGVTPPPYSLSIEAAWLVVEHFRSRDYWVRVQEMPDNRPFWQDAEDPRSKIHKRALCLIEGFNLPLSERVDGRGYGDTAAEAICRAALDATRRQDAP